MRVTLLTILLISLAGRSIASSGLDADASDGFNLTIVGCIESSGIGSVSSQDWIPPSNGSGTITNSYNSSKCVDIADYSPDDGAVVREWHCTV